MACTCARVGLEDTSSNNAREVQSGRQEMQPREVRTAEHRNVAVVARNHWGRVSGPT